jgi:serine protease AprX
MNIRKIFSFVLLILFAVQTASAGILVTKANGVTLTGADGVTLTGADGVTLTGADNFLAYKSNGVTLTGADGVTLTGADGATLTGADGVTYTGKNGVTLTGADGVTLTGVDGVTLTGADGVTLTGADGTIYRADNVQIIKASGVTLTGVDGATLTGVDGVTLTGADGVTLTGADGATLTGVDGVTLTGADNIIGFNSNGVAFSLINPNGATLTGADGVTLTGANGITISGADGVTLTGADNEEFGGTNSSNGIDSIDPELAILIDESTDDSTLNAVIVFHQYPDENDISALEGIGILGGTKYRVLPMITVTGTRQQIIEVSKLPNVRSIYGNRTLDLNVDPYFKNTAVQQIPSDHDLQVKNSGFPVSGKNITVAILDTGVNSQHNDLAGKVIQNVRLVDNQGSPIGFTNPSPIENIVNTDPISGHGTFVSGVVSASGVSSGGKYAGVAPGAKILGLSAGDLNLSYILAGFDYLLEKGSQYNVRVVNCSFSSNTVFDVNDPVNIATKMVTNKGINVVFSAGNAGPGNGTLNPYAAAPWVVSVGATDQNNNLAGFSSRGVFGNKLQKPTLVATGTNVVSLRSIASETGTLGLTVGGDVQRLTPAELPFYTTANGTSFSAPQVAGAIALMLEANPNLTPSQIKDILQRTATPLPKYFQHEVGAGVLNTYAAVLESAFPQRRMGIYRSVLNTKNVKFTSYLSHTFENTVNPGHSVSYSFELPENIIQSGVHIYWGMGVNDLGLQLFDSQNNMIGNSNYLNLPGLTGKREKIVLDNPKAQTYRASVQHTGGMGTVQRYFGAVEVTKVDFNGISDLDSVSNEIKEIIKFSLRSNILSTHGSKFHPNFSVSRKELATSLIRSGKVLQYMAANPMFTDVRDKTTRCIVESVQSDSRGKLFIDATSGSTFRPYNQASKLITAIALVKAGNFEEIAQTASLPTNVIDSSSIPSQYRGYVAVALQKGFISLDGNKFNSNRALTRQELAIGITNLLNS